MTFNNYECDVKNYISMDEKKVLENNILRCLFSLKYEELSDILKLHNPDLNYHYDGKYIPLNLACYHCSLFPEFAKLLLDYGADINLVNSEYNNTPIMSSYRSMKKDMVNLLVERGANILGTDEGLLGLKYSFLTNNYSFANELVNKGSNLDLLYNAVELFHVDIERFIERCNELRMKNSKIKKAIHL